MMTLIFLASSSGRFCIRMSSGWWTLQGPDRVQGFRAELRLRHKQGHWVWCEVFGVLVPRINPVDVGEPWWFVARDIEEERLARERLARANRLEGVGILAAGLAHDFNNLLMVMRGFAESMPASSERTSILAAADEASDLTANLLAFGRRDAGNEAVIDLSSNILKWTNMLQRLLGSTSRLETQLPDTAVWCAISEGQLNQILLNLATNAKHAMPMGSVLQIQLVTLELALPEAQQHNLQPGQYARLSVIDDGVGMSTDVLAQAVDPFFTTKAPTAGSGLGLASVYGIVTALSGTLELESTPRAGTSVLICLPIMPPEEMAVGATDRGFAEVLSVPGDRGRPVDARPTESADNQERVP